MYGLACYTFTLPAGPAPPKKRSTSRSKTRQMRNPEPCLLPNRQNLHSSPTHSLILLLSAETEWASSRGVCQLRFTSRCFLIALPTAPSPPSPAHSAPPTFRVSYLSLPQPFWSALWVIIVRVRPSWRMCCIYQNGPAITTIRRSRNNE